MPGDLLSDLQGDFVAYHSQTIGLNSNSLACLPSIDCHTLLETHSSYILTSLLKNKLSTRDNHACEYEV